MYFSITYATDPRSASSIKEPLIWLGYKLIYDESENQAMSTWDKQIKAHFTYVYMQQPSVPLSDEKFEEITYMIFGKKYQRPKSIIDVYYFAKKIDSDGFNQGFQSNTNTKVETQAMFAALILAIAYQHGAEKINITDIANHVTSYAGIHYLNKILLNKTEKKFIAYSSMLLSNHNTDWASPDSKNIWEQFFFENFKCKKELQEPELTFSFIGMVRGECYEHTDVAQVILTKYYSSRYSINNESNVFDRMKIIMINEHLSEYINQMSNKNLYARDLANCTVYWHTMSAKMKYLSIQNHDSDASRQAYFFGKTADKFAIATRKALGSNRSKYWTEEDTHFISLKISVSGADNKLNEFNQYNCSLDPSELDI